MRVSEISRWSECEAYALADPPRAPRWTHAATIVGTAAHALVAGMEYEVPAGVSIQFDATTPRPTAIMPQARDIARAAKETIARHGLTIITSEEPVAAEDFTGTLDIRAYGEGGDVIIDLKTGRMPSSAWLQVAGYCFAAGPGVAFGGVLHAPRVALNRTAEARLELRSARNLIPVWASAYKRIRTVQKGEEALRTPGAHCKRCPLETCGVRADFGGDA